MKELAPLLQALRQLVAGAQGRGRRCMHSQPASNPAPTAHARGRPAAPRLCQARTGVLCPVLGAALVLSKGQQHHLARSKG